VPKVKGTKMAILCFGPVFIGLKMGFPILLNQQIIYYGRYGILHKGTKVVYTFSI